MVYAGESCIMICEYIAICLASYILEVLSLSSGIAFSDCAVGNDFEKRKRIKNSF